MTHLNRELFAADAVAPETRRFNEMLETMQAKMPSLLNIPPEIVRREREAGRGPLGPILRLPHAETMAIPGPAGEIPLRVLRAPKPRGVFLHLHGGGFVFGAHDQQDAMLDRIARETGLTVVSVGYRLAPEHPYPAAPDDCEAAALWLIQNAQREFGAGPLAIGGESAGAHLSVVSLLRLRDKHGLSPFRAAHLAYGGYDLTLTPSVDLWGDRLLFLSAPILRRYTDMFVPDVQQRRRPDVSPLYANLKGMPPALFTVGTQDPLLDDTLFMCSRWTAAGGVADLAVYPGGIHGFNAFPIPLAEQANKKIVDFLSAVQ